MIDEWIVSDNIWLQRCALLIHLKKSEEVDLDYMFETILRLCGTGEFFIDKAIVSDCLTCTAYHIISHYQEIF